MKKLFAGLIGAAMMASPALAAKGDVRVSGQGTLNDGRIFNVSAVLYTDGTVKGHATLINHAFSGDSGKGPYKLYVDITCVNQLDDGTVYIGGETRRTNDSSLVDAVFFAVRDDGKNDQLSRAYFWDDNPGTVGDSQACKLNVAGDFLLEEVIRGNIKVN